VWWSSSTLMNPNGISGAHMSWDGSEMWVMTTGCGARSTEARPDLKEWRHAELVRGGLGRPQQSIGGRGKGLFL
jgi:hypothetical protein